MKKISKTLVFIVCLACISVICSLSGCGGYGKAYGVVNASQIKLNAVFVSDIHTDQNVLRDRNFVLRKSFSAIASSSDYDLFLSAGDNTNSGVESEYRVLKGLINDFLTADRYVFAMGNHDSWHESARPDFEKARAGFMDFCGDLGYNSTKTYYFTEVKGYSFICTGYDASRLEGDDAFIDEEQFLWLENQINAAMGSNLPIFVVHHQPFENMSDLEGLRLRIILEQCAENYDKPIIVITGHQHDLDEDTFTREDNELYFLNLPSILFSDEGGLAFAMEVYENSVVFRGRNFITGEWVDNQQYVINY